MRSVAVRVDRLDGQTTRSTFEGPRTRDVGLVAATASVEFRLADIVSLHVLGTIGANEETVQAGGGVRLDLGTGQPAVVSLGFQGITSYGLTASAWMRWETAVNTPLGAGIELTSQPGANAQWGLRLLAEGARLAAPTGVARLQQEAHAWRWPVRAKASSTYGGGWGPTAAIGPPTVFPRHGDISGAWAPRASGDGAQWLEVAFDEDPTPIEEVLVFETHLPGALYAVVAQDADGAVETLWQRPPSALAPVAMVLSVRVARPRPLRSLRLWVDTDAVSAWPEIDAVALVPLARRD